MEVVRVVARPWSAWDLLSGGGGMWGAFAECRRSPAQGFALKGR